MSIREEFEKAFTDWKNDWDKRGDYPTTQECALWAAKWMAEMCHKAVRTSTTEVDAMHKIRQLAKELSNDKE